MVDEEISRPPIPDHSMGLTPGEEDIPETCHHSQALESLMTLDIDISTILEDQEDNDINDCIIIDEYIAISVNQKISLNIPTNDDSSPLPTCTNGEPESSR